MLVLSYPLFPFSQSGGLIFFLSLEGLSPSELNSLVGKSYIVIWENEHPRLHTVAFYLGFASTMVCPLHKAGGSRSSLVGLLVSVLPLESVL